jgi:hypothetical protein
MDKTTLDVEICHWDTQMADSERYGMGMVMWLSSGSLLGRSMSLQV